MATRILARPLLSSTVMTPRDDPIPSFPFPEFDATTTIDGDERRIGFEIELAGLSVDEVASTIERRIGGQTQRSTRFQCYVRNSQLGDVRVELDTRYLKEERYRRWLKDLDFRVEDIRSVEDALETVAKGFLPCEVVTAPIPLSKAPIIERVRDALRTAQAEGTASSVRYALGLHVNPEAASLDADDLRDVLASFLLLYDWIVDRDGIDWTRRLTPFIDPFPSRYVRTVVDPEYRPTLDILIDDYLHANPTRNRALDMLPIFLTLDEARVRRVVSDSAASARPAFHFRLPDCRINEPEWRIGGAVGRWAQVERLAADRQRLDALGRAYLQQRPHAVLGDKGQWLRTVNAAMNSQGQS